MTKKNVFIRKRFKEQEKALLLLMQKDPIFLELCEDYELCLEATDYWSGKEEPGAREKANEFQSIATDLEIEISMKLAGFKA
ncbi:MAG: hypothetical protein KJP19_03755 [Deltaproteobacteria bacterium]|nr:hypothetical protein [Deltaproteobacteria bacterium]RZW14534.1 MAG: hypothetical protein EX260_10705 [Desulfobulbaceae bacterium]